MIVGERTSMADVEKDFDESNSMERRFKNISINISLTKYKRKILMIGKHLICNCLSKTGNTAVSCNW